ncbi:hypothetical protein BG004_006779 [Podila humilis]|nr:hypothetical protein BG004_006779 [Podila humilis]
MSVRSRLAFIGGGNMAEAILGGLLSTGYPLTRCVVSEPIQSRCEFLQDKYPGLQVLSGPSANQLAVNGSTSPASTAALISEGAVHINPTAASSHSDFASADVVILAVKPQVLRSVVEDLGGILRTKKPLVISIAAGIETIAIARFMAEGTHVDFRSLPPVIRVMPNTPSLVLEGAAGLYATTDATPAQRNLAESLMSAVSKQVSWVEHEPLIDTVTGISGSGPAYFFLMMEAMEEAGVSLGMDRETAKALTIQTCLGAAKMAQSSSDDLKTLRVKVTSPHGTTDAAIKSFEAGGFRELVRKSVAAADSRSKELAMELGTKDITNKL